MFGIDRTPNPGENGGMSDIYGAEALDHLSEATASVGLEFTLADSDVGVDAYIAIPGEKPIAIEVKQRSLVSSRDVQQVTAGCKEADDYKDAMSVIVADRITAEAKAELRRAGWGWLDLRGHLHLRSKGLLVDATIASLGETRGDSEPFAGRVGIEVAVATLLEPERALGVRQLATMLHRAPSSVSTALAALRQAGLIDAAGGSRTPELFWELASAWKPKHVMVRPLPMGDVGVLQALRVNIDDVAQPGWALSDARAAAAYGAPIAIRADQQHDFYVPDERVMRRAVQLLGEPELRVGRGVTLRVAPSDAVCAQREDPTKHGWNRTHEHWPLAHPLFVAIDLAQDPGRGREVLNDWTPPEPWHRVW